MTRRLTRRDLLKAVPAAGLLAAGVALTSRGRARTETIAGNCRMCLARCGFRATVQDDRVVRVEGDPASRTGGFLCMHGMAIREMVHSRERLLHPLKRVGGSFQEVSWEQAFREIAERLAAVKEESGPQALAVQTGWGLVGDPLQAFLLRFCQAFGTPNFATVESLCQASMRIGQSLTVGAKCKADALRSRTLVLWGANPTVSQPAWARVVASMVPTDRNLVVIDPVRTEFAAGATLHLRLRPGTDGALALGLMRVIVEEGLYDRKYVERFTLGFDRLLERIPHYDLARVARITSLDEQEIVEAARIIAEQGPTSTWIGLGVEHHDHGLQTVRAITVLAALCGHVDVPGGNLLQTRVDRRVAGEPVPSLHRLTTPRPAPPPVATRPIGYDEYPIFEIFMRQAQANLFARAILEHAPYPLRALILFGSNAMITGPGAERLRRAADKLSLLVSVDPFLTASGEMADYVLPAATFVEGEHETVAGDERLRSPLVAERGASRTDWKILTGLAAALGLERYFPWATLEEAMEAPREPFMRPDRTLIAEHVARRSRFPTVSGKVEIYSRTLERYGYDPLPGWTPPAERPDDDFPLILVTGPRTHAYINSQYRQLPSVRRMMPRPLVEVHPDAALAAGIEEGQLVAVVSPHGRFELHAEVTDRVHPDCVVLPSGWAGVNRLTQDGRLDPLSGFPAFRSGVCRIEPPAYSKRISSTISSQETNASA